MNYALDTDTILDYLKNEPTAVGSLSSLFERQNQFYMSVISIAEYYHGAHASLRKEYEIGLLNQFLNYANVNIIDVTQEIAQEYGKIQGSLQRQGKLGSMADILIAATCIVHKLTLITGNQKDFIKVSGLSIQ